MNECCEGRFRRFRASIPLIVYSVRTALALPLSVGTKSLALPLVGLLGRTRRPCAKPCVLLDATIPRPWHHQARRLASTRVLPLSLRWRGRGTVSSRTKAPTMQALLHGMREHANSQREEPGPPRTGAFQKAALQADRLP